MPSASWIALQNAHQTYFIVVKQSTLSMNEAECYMYTKLLKLVLYVENCLIGSHDQNCIQWHKKLLTSKQKEYIFKKEK
jgi:hypothetical protein